MTITALPARIRADATALVIVMAAPNRTVAWSMSGPGTLEIITDVTDAGGRAYAKYVPDGGTGSAIVSAVYGDA